MAEPKNKKPFPVPFGPDGFITKKIKKQSTDTKSQKAKVEKQMKLQKEKTFVPGTQTQRPVNQEGARVYRPDYTKIQRVTPEESYKKPEATVSKTKTYRATEAGTDYPVYDSKPSTTTTPPSYTKKTETPKPGNMEEGKKKMTGDTSLAAQAMQNAQSLLDRSLRKKK